MARRRNFGSTRQLPSGRWQARYFEEGRHVPLEETFPTDQEAARALARVQTDMDRGAHVSPNRSAVTLSEYWAEYSTTKRDWKATTRQNRQDVWRLYIEPTFGKTPLGQITTSKVKGWHAALHQRIPSSAEGAYRLLRQILNAAITETPPRLVVNPCKVKGAGVDRAPERQIATVAELEAIVAELPERMRLLPLLAVYNGLRRSELLGLRRRDLDSMHRESTVAQTLHHLKGGQVVTQDPKTKAGRRTVAFPSSIAPDVADHLARFVGPEPDALVFTGEQGGPLRPHVFGKAFRRARNLAGRPDLTLHDLRHTADTLAAATGATLPELMYRMGHATPHSALRYLHATKDRDRVIGEALAELRPSAPVVPLPVTRHG
jgi:integrase